MKCFALIICAAVALTGCLSVASGAETARAAHAVFGPSAHVRSLHVENVSGNVAVTGWSGNTLTIDAMKRGSNTAALSRTHVEITQNGSEIDVRTRYDNSGIFGSSNGASVDYTIRVPAQTGVDVKNVSGNISLHGVSGDVQAHDVSGDVRASLGRLDSSRTVQLDTVSGAIGVQIAKNSDAQIQAKTISGAIRTFFPSNVQKGFVGENLSGSIGSGGAKMDLHTISGAINVSAQ